MHNHEQGATLAYVPGTTYVKTKEYGTERFEVFPQKEVPTM